MLYLWVGRHPVVPLVLMCRVWRWRDVEVDQLVRLPICQYTPDILLECCNPYHWARGANPGIVFCIQYSYSVSIYIYTCLSVCLYPINVKTAEPIGTKFCVGPHMTPGKVFVWSKFQKLASNKIRFSLNFLYPRTFFVIVLQCLQKENVHNWNTRWARSAQKA